MFYCSDTCRTKRKLIMDFNKKESSDNGEKLKNKISTLIGGRVMTLFILRAVIVWVLIFIAFWLGAGCIGLRQWDEHARYVMVFIMITSLVPVIISIQFGDDE